MKANRKFVLEDEAVSPVIAVILMVAITVVLAATVFVLVSDIGSNTSKNAPQMGWSDDETNDKWTVNQAPNQVSWAAFQMKATEDLTVSLNGDTGTLAITASYAPIADDTFDGDADVDYVAGGDFLKFCGTGGIEANVQVTLMHTASNAIAHQFTFVSVPDCTP